MLWKGETNLSTQKNQEKSMGKLVRRVREPSEGFGFKHS